MTDNWDDDSDDEWDVDDDALDQKLGLAKKNDFADEEDLAVKEKLAADKEKHVELKKKGSALAAKKQAEKDQKEELEIARKAMELEAEMEAKMTVDERRALERQRIEDADHALTDDLFGGGGKEAAPTGKAAQMAGDKVVMKDMKDHMKHARKVAECMNGHGKITFATIFIKEVLQQTRDLLDDDAITDIIKTCNVIKNEKVQAAKKKVKGQAQKSKKQDKVEKVKAQKLQNEIFGDSNQYDDYDQMGEDYEDAYF